MDTSSNDSDSSLQENSSDNSFTGPFTNSDKLESHSQKRAWQLHGVKMVFGSSSQKTPDYFDGVVQFVENQIDQQAATNGQLRKLLTAMETTTDSMDIETNELERNNSNIPSDKKVRQKIQFDNMRFLDFMSQVIKLSQEHNQDKSTTQLKPTYNFKAANPSMNENAFDRLWNERFKELVQFKKEFGHSNVSRTTKGYEQLGNWLADQRRKLRRGKMTEAQFKSLSELGVEWERS